MQPEVEMQLPNGSILAASETGDPDYPGLCMTVDGAVAAVVEWHPEHEEIVVRLYVSPEAYEASGNVDEEPVAYFGWRTGRPLPT